MRMWMVNPKKLCQKHLLGEHGEIHKHRHNFVKRHSIEGRRGQIYPEKMKVRHDELAEEIISRGMNHKSPYEQPDLSTYNLQGFVVNIEASLQELQNRCQRCSERIRGSEK